MADQKVTGAIGGAAQGAAAGAVFGPVGAVVGGVIGGIGGLLGGSAAAKAAKYQRRAAKFEAKSKMQTAALARRDLLRTARVQQAQGIAMAAAEEGGLQSSTTQGARGSATSQLGFGLGYIQNQTLLQRAVTVNLEKAGASANQAADIFGLVSSVSSAVGTIGASIPRRPPTGGGVGTDVGGLGAPIGGVGAGGYTPATSPSSGIGLTQVLDQRGLA